MSETPEMPVELVAALADSEDAQQNWAAATPDLRRLYIDYVSAPRLRRVRRERAAITALAASLGTLREHSQSSLTWWDAVLSSLPL